MKKANSFDVLMAEKGLYNNPYVSKMGENIR